MSLILDALNRADQERNQEQNSPYISRYHQLSSKTEKSAKWRLIVAPITVLAAIILIVSQSYDYKIVIEQTSTDNTSIHKSIIHDTKKINHLITAEPIVEQPPLLPKKSITLAVPPLPTEPNQTNKTNTSTISPPSNIEEPTQDRAPVNNVPTNKEITSLYQQNPVAEKLQIATPENQHPTIATSEPAKHQTTTKSKPTKPINNSHKILQQLPLLVQMSQRFQNSIPNIDYTVHVFSQNEQAGFVTLNGTIRRIGSQLAPNLTVIAILNDSVVLDYQGTQFRLLALNSWITF